MQKFEQLRPRPYIVFVAKIYVGTTMYVVCGNNIFKERYFHTKKESARYIRDTFVGDEKRIRLYDLKNA